MTTTRCPHCFGDHDGCNPSTPRCSASKAARQGDHSTSAAVARHAAESALLDGETLADDMTRVDGCCTWTVAQEVRS